MSIKEADPYNESGNNDSLVPLPLKIPYTYEMAELIISKIFDGNKIRDIAGKHGVPDRATIFSWLHKYPDFRQAYEVARESLALVAAEEIQGMSEDTKYLDKDDVPASRLRFDVLKFIAERNDRARYAQSNPRSDNDSGVTIIVDTGVKVDKSDTRTVEDLVYEMKTDEYSEGGRDLEAIPSSSDE